MGRLVRICLNLLVVVLPCAPALAQSPTSQPAGDRWLGLPRLTDAPADSPRELFNLPAPVAPFWPLPKALATPHVLPAERTTRAGLPPSMDMPPVGSIADAPRPHFVTRPAAWAPPYEPAAIVTFTYRNRPDNDRATHLTDPTSDQSTLFVLARQPLYRSRPAPFLRLSVPDPFEAAGTLRLREPLPDADPPLMPVLPPERVKISVK